MSNEEKKKKKKFKRPIFHKIINFFVGIFGTIAFLLIIFFGFSQTKTFRNYLKEQITTSVSESINGKLTIDEIEGSLLTSVILHNTALTTQGETLLNAKEIILKTSPIHLLLKRIMVREFILRDASIKLLQNKDSSWNYERLSETSDTTEIDTSKSTFPFSIQVNKIAFKNINFIKQTYNNINSNQYYKHLTSDDIRLNNIHLDAKMFINLSSSTMRFYLNNLSVQPNFDAFTLKKLSADIELNEKFASVNNLIVITDSSDIHLSAKMDQLNLLGNVELKSFKDYPIALNLEAYPIKFSDLYIFIDQVDFLNDGINAKLTADGYFGDLNIRKLNLSFLNSVLNAKGNVKDLHNPEKLYLDINIFDSHLVSEEAHQVVKGLNIPYYKDLELKNLNASFKGFPTKFNTKLTSNISDGKVKIESYFDFTKKEMEYNTKFETYKLDLQPIINNNSSLTLKGFIKGYGTDPQKMQTEVNVKASNSSFTNIDFDSLTLTSTMFDKVLDVNLASNVNDAYLTIDGALNLENKDEPQFNVSGLVDNLKLNRFTDNPQDSSDLNLTFNAKGKNLDLDNIAGNLELKLNPSYLRDLKLDETTITLDLILENQAREINLISDFVDFNIDGNFSLQKAIELLTYEGTTIADILIKDISELNPMKTETDSVIEKSVTSFSVPDIAKENIKFNYSFKFKDFDLIALFLKNEALNVIGHGEGVVSNDSSFFEIATEITLDNFLTKNKEDLFYLSGTSVNLNLSRDNQAASLNKLFGSISIESDKIYFGSEITNLETDFVFNQNKLFFNTALDFEKNIHTEIEGIALTTEKEDRIYFNDILFAYKNIPWTSYDTTKMFLTDDGLQISDLNLVNKFSLINIDGQLNNDETHNFFVQVKDVPGNILSSLFFDKNSDPISGELSLKIQSTGFLNEPSIKTDFYMHDINYKKTDFGSLSCIMNHNKGNTLLDVDFVNSKIDPNYPLLTIDGYLPFKFDYYNLSELVQNDDDIFIALRANGFNIASLGNIIPYIKNQSGKVTSEIDLTGSLNDLNTDGFFNISQGKFTAIPNNLSYNMNLTTIFNNQTGTIKDFTLENMDGPRYRGKIRGFGEIKIDELPFSAFNLTFTGDLALLDKTFSPNTAEVYGDLLINTGDKWQLKYSDNKYNFFGDVIIDRADLVYTSKENNRFATNSNIIYEIITDTTNLKYDSDKYITFLRGKDFKNSTNGELSSTEFNFNTKIIIKNIATIKFIIAPELNQELLVETTGNLELATVRNKIRAQGSLELKNGSRLEFFKTLDATGTVRFENDLADPYLNISATYINQISNFEGSGNTEDVAVKVKMNSAFSNLKENLAKNKDYLTVYTGRTDIANDVPNSQYDQSNAIIFILSDKLNLDSESDENSAFSNLPSNAALSFVTSKIGNFLNTNLGGLINDFRVNKNNDRDSYKLLFSGKYNNIRYSFGGNFGSNSEYLQLSKADVKVEYYFTPNLILRVEQKDPVIQTSYDEKIQEGALKYKFEF